MNRAYDLRLQVRVVAISEISEPDWPSGGIFPYVAVFFGKVRA